MYRYLFILGRVPAASILELHAVLLRRKAGLSLASVSYTDAGIIATTDTPMDCTTLIRQLGGTVKIATILDEQLSDDDNENAKILSRIIESGSDPAKRITFGFSSYALTSDRTWPGRRIERLGISVKKILKGKGLSARYIAPKKGDGALSSVTTEKQGLLKENGWEILFWSDAHGHIARTCAVQPFEEFSIRDWERPEKSMDVGMLPPKLARMMVNIAGLPKDGVLLDPFCGLGTILQEALILGYENVLGSDISKENIRATRKNLAWIAERQTRSLAHVRTLVQDARSLSKSFTTESIDAIVTEPYLGPVVRKSGIKNLDAIIAELSELYCAFFREAHSLLKKGGKVVIVLPVWLEGRDSVALPIIPRILSLGFESPPRRTPVTFSNRGSILIVREGQHVGRELFIFTKRSL